MHMSTIKLIITREPKVGLSPLYLEVGLLLGALHGRASLADLQEGGLLLVNIAEVQNKKPVEIKKTKEIRNNTNKQKRNFDSVQQSGVPVRPLPVLRGPPYIYALFNVESRHHK
jgi:hypothetical protein